MKLKNIIYTTTLTAVMVAAVMGCSKKKFDINSNPDDVTDVSVTPSVLLPGAQQETSSIIAREFWWMDWWMGHGARSGSYQSLNEEETYKFTNDFHVAIWNSLYSNANNYNLMIKKAIETGGGTYEAIGRIMKSHNFQILTDIYGNIPYSEAFQGTAAATPKYDKSIDIYKAIFAELDKAIVLLKDPLATDPAKNPDIAVADLVYGGNTGRWIQFANTLRLRMLVHLYNGTTTQTIAPGIDVPAQVAKITAEGFIGAGQSAHLNPGFSGSKPQPYFRYYNTNEAGSGSQRDHLRASEYAIEYYKVDGDYRIGYFYTPPVAITNTTNSSGNQVTNYFTAHLGIPFGTPSGASAPLGDQLSNIRGKGYSPTGATSRAWILTSVESLFLQAEARQRGILTTGATAKDLLTSAITESFVWLDAKRPPLQKVSSPGNTNPGDSIVFTPAQSAAMYMANNAGWPDVDYTATGVPPGNTPPAGGLYTILQQKWFALNMIAPYEIWTDWRRTNIVYGLGGGYDPGPTISVDPNRGTTIPVRLFYPQNEYNYNATNVGAEGTINVLTGKLFWDL
jgi:Starch-binding associating with outer membrane